MKQSGEDLTVSVVIPSYLRPKDLERCLTALVNQQRKAEEIVIIARPDDTGTWDVIAAFEKKLPIVQVQVFEPGLIQAENAGIKVASGKIIAFTDDDAEPHQDWVEKIMKTFQESSPMIVGVGGRDIIYQDGSPMNKCNKIIGKVSWFGRLQGNHAYGCGAARLVDTLKGVNMAYRSEFLKPLGLDARLLGTGAQMHSELMLGSHAKKQGFRLLYDPQIAVDHYPGKRFGRDSRDVFNFQTMVENVHNETLGILNYLNVPQKLAFVMWAIIVGHRGAPGLIQVARLKIYGYPSVSMFLAAQKGRFLGLRRYIHDQVN